MHRIFDPRKLFVITGGKMSKNCTSEVTFTTPWFRLFGKGAKNANNKAENAPNYPRIAGSFWAKI